MNLVLWVVQGLLALSCVFSGLSKAFRPLAKVHQQFLWANHVPAALVRFIGVSELLGGDRTGSAFGAWDFPVVDGGCRCRTRAAHALCRSLPCFAPGISVNRRECCAVGAFGADRDWPFGLGINPNIPWAVLRVNPGSSSYEREARGRRESDRNKEANHQVKRVKTAWKMRMMY